jgi:site-specific DNA-methyltransferase (adenine-specific)
VPKKTGTPPAPRPLYQRRRPRPARKRPLVAAPDDPWSHARPVSTAPFVLREDGEVEPVAVPEAPPAISPAATGSPTSRAAAPRLLYRSDTPFIRLYQGNCLELLDAIAAKYPEGRFDAIFADPPYFLSNGGITCHAGRMVRVDKGDWDKSRGPELNHAFNLEWLRRCQRVLKPNGTLWVTGTLHVIFSIGYALQQLGFKLLNDIAWEKPNPPPNLSCRYFTHSTETLLWAAKNEKSKHTFNYAAMKAVTGKQMKTVWRDLKADEQAWTTENRPQPAEPDAAAPSSTLDPLSSIWTVPAPGSEEKTFGKHPTQKPVALIERCLLASTHEGDLVLDPFLGSGTTAIACIRLKRGCVGIELDEAYADLAVKRVKEAVETGRDLFSSQVTGGGDVRKQKLPHPRGVCSCVHGNAYAGCHPQVRLHALGDDAGESREPPPASGVLRGPRHATSPRCGLCSRTDRLTSLHRRPASADSVRVRTAWPHQLGICYQGRRHIGLCHRRAFCRPQRSIGPLFRRVASRPGF